MTTQTESFWTRLTGPFRRSSRGEADDRTSRSVSESDLLSQPAETPETTTEAPGRPNPLALWRRRDQAIIQLQEGYEKVTRVVEEIQNHLVQQGERSERICGALEQIARAMAESPQIARQQAQTLDTIAAQLAAANARSEQLAQVVGEIPKAARAQSDALAGIGRQLETSQEQSSQTMDRLGANIAALGASSQTQSQILREISHQAAEQSEQLTRLIAYQGKRFTMLFVVTLIMALAAIGAAVVGLVVARP